MKSEVFKNLPVSYGVHGHLSSFLWSASSITQSTAVQVHSLHNRSAMRPTNKQSALQKVIKLVFHITQFSLLNLTSSALQKGIFSLDLMIARSIAELPSSLTTFRVIKSK